MYIVDTLSTYIICFSRFNLSLFFFQIKKNEPTNIISIISNNVLYIKFLARIPKNKICIENRITSEEENNTRKRKEKPRKWISKEFLSFIISYTSCVCVCLFFFLQETNHHHQTSNNMLYFFFEISIFFFRHYFFYYLLKYPQSHFFVLLIHYLLLPFFAFITCFFVF